MKILKDHPDGKWWTSEHEYLGSKLLIKMSENRGSKIHIFPVDEGKVLKTFRFRFATEDYLLTKAKRWINENNIKI